MQLHSKLPHTGATIFTVMSALAQTHGAINLSQGFPNYDPPAELMELVYRHMQASHNQYAPMAGLPALRERLAAKAEALYGAKLDPESEITITAGATQALFTAITALVRPGDEVVVLEPAYDSYQPAVEVNGGKVVAYRMAPPDYRIDWPQLASLLTPRTRLIVLNTPHNPTGTVLGPTDWEALAQLLEGTDIFVLSDEVYEHLTYDGVPHASILRHPSLYARALVTYSFGKTFHSTGWKVGYCLAPPALTTEFRKVHQFNVFSVNTPVQYALADFLANADTYLQLPEFYQAKRDFFLAEMTGSSLRPLRCAGTYFQLFDYSHISDLPDTEFAKWLTREVGVAAIPVSAFYRGGDRAQLIRLCFAKTEALLAEAATRLRAL